MKETKLLLQFINDSSAKEPDIEQIDFRLFSYRGTSSNGCAINLYYY